MDNQEDSQDDEDLNLPGENLSSLARVHMRPSIKLMITVNADRDPSGPMHCTYSQHSSKTTTQACRRMM